MTPDHHARFQAVTVVILAGGQGARMGRLKQFSAKATLPAYDRPLLVRLFDQALSAGCTEILVTTSPTHFCQIEGLVKNYRDLKPAATYRPVDNIRLIRNPAHSVGSLQALSVALEQVTTDLCMMCLGDIYFRGNPFSLLVDSVARGEIFLIVTDATIPEEASVGGLVYSTGLVVEAIVERPQPATGTGTRWSGIALFNKEIQSDLKNFLKVAPSRAPEEEFFAFCLNQGRQVRAVFGPDFINVNSPEHLLLAALYTFSEVYETDDEMYHLFANTACQFRRKLAVSGAKP